MNISVKPVAPLPSIAANPGFEPDGEGGCAMREVLDRIGDTWTVLVIINLKSQPTRFNALRRWPCWPGPYSRLLTGDFGRPQIFSPRRRSILYFADSRLLIAFPFQKITPGT